MERLKPVLHKFISPNQGGFVEKRKMIENILIVQEEIHSIKIRGDKGTVIKPYMKNSFDGVRQNFLFAILARFSFGADFLSWIVACIKNP
jgi:hypothetical protein